MAVFKFGKHKNVPLERVPSSYLRWALGTITDLNPWLRGEVEDELRRRGYGGREHHADPPRQAQQQGGQLVNVREALQTWFREASLRFHPDRGGSHEAMVAINWANDRLKQLAGVP